MARNHATNSPAIIAIPRTPGGIVPVTSNTSTASAPAPTTRCIGGSPREYVVRNDSCLSSNTSNAATMSSMVTPSGKSNVHSIIRVYWVVSVIQDRVLACPLVHGPSAARKPENFAKTWPAAIRVTGGIPSGG
ncbi:MAG TPA: hypothetical protein VNV62_24180 [Trebonia sp.]|nr:hypothetical protein [Trebonia sp.]